MDKRRLSDNAGNPPVSILGPSSSSKEKRNVRHQDPDHRSLSPRSVSPMMGGPHAGSHNEAFGCTPKSSKSGTVELLVVGSEEHQLPIARGLSIKLSPPEEDELGTHKGDDDTSTDSNAGTSAGAPKYYYSLSGVSMASLGSMGSDMELRPPMDRVNSQPYQNVPINRTESRLPSLETLLGDERLKDSLFGTESNAFLRDFALVLRLTSPRDRFRGEQELVKKSVSVDEYKFASMPVEERIKTIDAIVLMIKQEVAKHVDQWRYLVDQKKEGQFSEDQFQDLLCQPDYEVCIEPWGHISLGLKMLRNFCTDAETQALIHAHRVADLLMTRKLLLYIAVTFAQSGAASSAAVEYHQLFGEVRNNLVKTVLTFFSNLLTANEQIQVHMWNILWPHGYYMLALLAGADQLNHLAMLLHNHISAGLERGSMPIPKDVDEFEVVGKGYQKVMDGVAWLASPLPDKAGLIAEELDGVDESKAGIPSGGLTMLKFFRLFLSAPVMMAHEEREARRKGKNRVAFTRKGSEGVTVDDWFSLLLLKLFNLNKGEGFIRLIHGLAYLQTREDKMIKLQNESIAAAVSQSAKETPTKKAVTPSMDVLITIDCPKETRDIVALNSNRILLYIYTWPAKFFAKAVECATVCVSAADQLTLPERGLQPEPVAPESVPQIIGGRISPAGEKPSVPSEGPAGTEALILSHSMSVRTVPSKQAIRRWGSMHRNFLTDKTCVAMTSLFTRAVEGFATVAVQYQPEAAARALKSCSETSAESLFRGIPVSSAHYLLSSSLRFLLTLSVADETSDILKNNHMETIVGAISQILDIMSPALMDHLKAEAARKGAAEPGGRPEADGGYLALLEFVSPSDSLRLLSQCCDAQPKCKDVIEKVQGIKNVLSFQGSLQEEDLGCSEASVLAIKVLTQNHPGNSKLLTDCRKPR